MHLQLTKKEIAEIKRLCAVSEQKAELTAALLNIIYKKKWFKLFEIEILHTSSNESLQPTARAFCCADIPCYVSPNRC